MSARERANENELAEISREIKELNRTLQNCFLFRPPEPTFRDRMTGAEREKHDIEVAHRITHLLGHLFGWTVLGGIVATILFTIADFLEIDGDGLRTTLLLVPILVGAAYGAKRASAYLPQR